MVLSGGDDVSPHYYSEKPGDSTINSPARDRWELELFKRAYDRGMPVLGICRGMQLINVALGGTLYQDVNEHPDIGENHGPAETDYTHHYIKIDEKSRLFDVLCSSKIEVNSFHHQAIKRLASSLRVVAVSESGVIEAVEDIGKKFILGVQWHPEELINEKPCFLTAFKMIVDEIQE